MYVQKNGASIIILKFTAVTLVKFVEIFKFSFMLCFFDKKVKIVIFDHKIEFSALDSIILELLHIKIEV